MAKFVNDFDNLQGHFYFLAYFSTTLWLKLRGYGRRKAFRAVYVFLLSKFDHFQTTHFRPFLHHLKTCYHSPIA
jgi:hypothetical protein